MPLHLVVDLPVFTIYVKISKRFPEQSTVAERLADVAADVTMH